MCTSPRPNEAENNRLQVYIPATDVIELLDGDPRLNRVSDIGALTTYMFGPLVASDNGTIVSCTTSQMNSPNATIVVTCECWHTYIACTVYGDNYACHHNLFTKFFANFVNLFR